MKKEEIKIQVNTFNWGPCVTRFKIQDDFRKVLLDEAKKTEQDFSDRLAGQIAKERGYSDKQRDIIIPYLSPYLGIYDEAFQRYQNKRYEHGNPEYALTALWCNFQRQYEFNPPHDHDGKISFVIYLQVPEEIKKENQAFVGKSCGPGGIQFVYGEGPRDCVTTLSYFPEVGDMFMFPSWLKHWVAPFKSDCLRISVSGNFHDQVPLNNVVNFAPQYIKDKKKK